MDVKAFDPTIIDPRIATRRRTRVASLVLLLTAPATLLMADVHWQTGFDVWKAIHLSLFAVLFALVAMLYFGLTVGGREQASLGMRIMGVAIARTDGRPMDFLTAIVHLAIFWIANALLTPLILLIGLFTDRGRLLHDLLIGTVAVRRDMY